MTLDIRPVDLRCEYLSYAFGMDTVRPRFSWRFSDRRRGAFQTAFRIVVADDIEKLHCETEYIWDTGRVESDCSIQVEYAGVCLQSYKRYWWKVMYWDQNGEASEWSEPSWFETALLHQNEWCADWIAAPERPSPSEINVGKWIWLGSEKRVWFRREIRVREDIALTGALLHIAADIVFILHINGTQVGANDGWGMVEYDLTEYLKPGNNLFEIECRRHFESAGVVAGLKIDYADGDSDMILTDADWQVAASSDGPWVAAEVVADYGADPWKTLPVKHGTPLPAPMFRNEFLIGGKINSARAYICGLGYYELYMNGKRVGDHVLDPAQTDYEKRAFYTTYDITDHLNQGENAVGVILGDGFFNQWMIWGGMSYGEPRLLLQIRIEYQDGQVDFITSNSDWRCAASPILMNNVYAGETYDARLEADGWCEVGFADAEWKPVRVVERPCERLEAQMMPPIKRMAIIKPTGITNPAPGVWIYDMGQNFAGWPRLSVTAQAGTVIRLRSAEVIGDDGFLDPTTTGVYHTHWVQADTYICKGDGVELWEPRFAYHGFRYVEMTGYPGEPSVENLEGVVVHTALDQAGRFECSNELINRIHEAALWTEISNLHSIPTDCPHREKCGWLGDAHVSAEMTIYNYDAALFWAKYMRDMRTVLRDGIPNMIAPGKRDCGMASIDWGTAMVQVPWYLYLYYGDVRILEESYPLWGRWMEYCRELAGDDHIIEGEGHKYGLGDWCPPGGNSKIDTPVPLTSTAYFYLDADIVAKTAALLGKNDDAREYSALAENIKNAFIERFWKGETAYGSQTADAVAIALGLYPEGRYKQAVAALARKIDAQGGHFTTGIMGLRFIFEAVSGDIDYGSRAFSMLTKTDYPGIGYTFELGATTLWEVLAENPPNPHRDYSLNHPMQGGFDAWFYYGVAGIRPDHNVPGFKRIVFKPSVVRDLNFARAGYRSMHGLIVSDWRRSGNEFAWKIIVPANTTALVYLPTSNISSISESDRPLDTVEGIKEAKVDGKWTLLDIVSGEYVFVMQVD